MTRPETIERPAAPESAADRAVLGIRAIAALLKTPAFITVAVADVRRRRSDAERRRAMRLSSREPEPNKAVRDKLRKLADQERLLAEAREAKNRVAISAALSQTRRLTREIEEARTRQLETAWAGHAVAESATLALVRGEEVDEAETVVNDWKRGKHGEIVRRKGVPQLTSERALTKRVISRTGLELAFTKGHLDGAKVSAPALYAMGIRYREAYEIVTVTGLGSTGEERIGTPRCTPSVGPADAVIEAARTLAGLREGLTRRQRIVLDVVCGRDESVKIAAQAIGSGVPTAKRHLVAGLVTVWENKNIG